MDALAKLLRKVSTTERILLLTTLRELRDSETRKLMDIKKLSGGEYYRARKGIFRVIFHFDDERVVIDALRLRNEKTYRNLK